jgi:hypothetical protein
MDELEPQQPEGELAGCPHLESSINGCIHSQRENWHQILTFDVHEGKPEDCPICNPKQKKPKMVSVDWLYESCPHSVLATRHECDECMEQLLKDDT